LLNAWLAQCDVPAAWVSLDANDNDSNRFWQYMLAALNPFLPGIVDAFLPVLSSSQKVSSESFLTSLINTLSTISQHVVLILDDYHLIRSDIIHGALHFLIEHLPQHIHIVIASRSEPPFSLARLYAQGEAAKLTLADLCFSSDETEAFFTRMTNDALSSVLMNKLRACTEGWVAGLQLVALSIQHCDDFVSFIETFSGSDRYIFDFFAEEVLRGLPEAIQQFLLQTSILDYLNGPLCDAVTDGTGSMEILIELERMNLFILSVDRERCRYRYHHLFARYLRQRLSLTHP